MLRDGENWTVDKLGKGEGPLGHDAKTGWMQRQRPFGVEKGENEGTF